MKPLRPLFHRAHKRDETEQAAERLKNRDWVEFLHVVHPSQAESAEREYLIARLAEDWKEITSPLLATHSVPTSLRGKNLLVLCDHNTFANELTLISGPVEKRIQVRYGYTIKIHARASRKVDWRPRTVPEGIEKPSQKLKSPANPILEKLIADLGKL